MNPMVCLNIFVLALGGAVVWEARGAVPAFTLQLSTFNLSS